MLLVKYSPYGECEIIYFVNCEISPFGRCEMKFAHIREANISHAAGVFHISQKYFTCPQGQISLKKALACASAFFWLGWPDLNRRVPESKSGALPLGDIPIFCQKVLYHRSLSLSRIFYLTLSFTFICSAPLIFKKRLRKVEFCDIL